jgi:YidC/Oxa1 family membrane protein insertase
VTHLHVLHFLVAAGSSNPFHYVIDFLRGILRTFHSFTASWGLAIILLTICVRIVLFPLTWKQFRSAQHMQMLQPKIKELQAKFKGDKQRLQQETMKLYQEHRVNPFASCMPLLLQLPIFFCLYYAIRGTPELREAHFLWLTLGARDPYFILLVLYVVSQLVSTELSLTYTTDSRQKWMMRAMPLFFVVVLLNFPSGLFVYWVTTNLWTIGQQLIIRKTMKTLPEAQAAKPRKQSRFLQAMSAAQEQRTGQGGSQRSGGRPGQSGKPVKKGTRPSQGGSGRPSGKPGGKPTGKPGARPAGKPSGQGGARPGQGGAGGRPSGQPAGKSQGSPSAGKPGARPSGKPGGRPQGKPGGAQGGAQGGRSGGQRPKPSGAPGGQS